MIATRREFMKLTTGVLAGMVLRPVAAANSDLFESRGCPVPFEPGGDRFVQTLRSGDSILGSVLIYQWEACCDFYPPLDIVMIAKLVRPDHQLVLLQANLAQHGHFRWQSTPGSEIVVPEHGEVVFKCSHVKGAGSVCFEKMV